MSRERQAIIDAFQQSMPGPRQAIAAMAAEFVPAQLPKGAFWLRPGQYCRHIAFLKSGLMRAAIDTEQGLHTRWAFLPGQFFVSLQSFSRQIPANEYIEALEDCEFYTLPHSRWQELYDSSDLLRRFWTTNLENLAACVEDRVHALLINDAKARYQHMLDHYPDFALHVPQKYVAEMLGIAPRHLSRIRKELSKGH